jgi:hypothetical protein
MEINYDEIKFSFSDDWVKFLPEEKRSAAMSDIEVVYGSKEENIMLYEAYWPLLPESKQKEFLTFIYKPE